MREIGEQEVRGNAGRDSLSLPHAFHERGDMAGGVREQQSRAGIQAGLALLLLARNSRLMIPAETALFPQRGSEVCRDHLVSCALSSWLKCGMLRHGTTWTSQAGVDVE